MASKKVNTYRITLEQVALASNEEVNQTPLQFEFDNHDEIFGIIDRVKTKNLFVHENQAIEFALGLKLFSEVMIKSRTHSLFEELAPTFKAFMQKLKSS